MRITKSRLRSMLVIQVALFGGSAVAIAADTPKTAPSDQLKPIVMNVWNGPPPNVVANAGPEVIKKGRVFNVSVPTMIVYLPDKARSNHVAFVYCPGGGYSHLAGLGGMADYFVPLGFTVIDLKYRTHMPSPRPERDALADAQRAMRVVRDHAKQWDINPNKIGIMGTSAGANAALNLETHYDSGNPSATDPVEKQSDRPDFGALLSFWPYLYNTKRFPITKGCPPTFMVHAKNDRTAPIAKAEQVADLLKKAGVPVELNIYPTGGHGVSRIGKGDGGKWPDKFIHFLKDNGILDKAAD